MREGLRLETQVEQEEYQDSTSRSSTEEMLSSVELHAPLCSAVKTGSTERLCAQGYSLHFVLILVPLPTSRFRLKDMNYIGQHYRDEVSWSILKG